MTRRLPLLVLSLLLVLALAASAGGASAAKPAKQSGGPRTKVFEACHRGCRYSTIQRAVDAAGSFARGHRSARVKVAIRPGRYREAVVVDGAAGGKDFDGLTIEGTSTGRKRAILEGHGARGPGGVAQNGVDATDVDGLVLQNLWARGFAANGFFVHSSATGGGRCAGYTMSNLLASGNRADGISARGCLGGRVIDSAAYRQGGAGFSVVETPCDSRAWSVFDGVPCQASPRQTLLRNDESHENAVGYAGRNAKYVLATENAFFNNGTGILDASVPTVGLAPGGWSAFERNDSFWNNYNPFLVESAGSAVDDGLGELDGRGLAYPTGVGIVLVGSDHDLVRGNHVFGNYKWGIASLSRPAESPFGEEFDEARSVDNEVIENFLGRGGADPNGEFDIWNDATGGGNCWGANSPGSTFAPGNGKLAPGQIYPVCPQAPVAYATAKSVNLIAGLQTSLIKPEDPSTALGYLGTDPPQDQQCSWVRSDSHLPFQLFVATELTPGPGEVNCERD